MKKSDAVQRPRSFPGRIKGFVKDVRTLTKDLRHRDRKNSFNSTATAESLSWDESGTESRAEAQNESPNPNLRDASYVTDLAVQVSLSFEEPLDFSYSRSYEASPSLKATDQLCQGLLRRVDHCSQELITRKDRNALDRTGTKGTGNGKPLRYEIEVQIIREGEIWATRTYRSYQKQPLTASAAHEVTMATHYMVGLYLRNHDNGFVWKDGPVRDDTSLPQETFPYRSARVQPMTCIPRRFFLEKSQEFESIPGFTIALNLKSCSPRHRSNELNESLEVHSNQTTPLNLTVAESSFFEATFVLEELLRSERKAFRKSHSSCEKSGGCATCRPHEGDKLELKLTVSNNLGPQYSHLKRTVLSHTSFFCNPQGKDFDIFVKNVESVLGRVRDEADDTMNDIDDLEFRITELRARDWSLDKPIVFKLGAENARSRRTVEAILERVQTSVADILKGNAMTVRMTAHKRGHTICDKTLVAKEPAEPSGSGRRRHLPLAKPKTQVLERLRKTIQRDFDNICLDTCSLGDQGDEGGASTSATDNVVLKTLPPMPEPDLVEKKQPILRLAATPLTMANRGSDVSSESRSEPRNVATGSSYNLEAVSDSPQGSNKPAASSQSSSNLLDSFTNTRSSPWVPSDKDANQTPEDMKKSEEEKHTSAPTSNISTVSEKSLPRAPISESAHSHDGGKSTRSTSKADTAAEAKSNTSVPSTPSLTCGEGSSPRSSLLVTPQAHQGAFNSAHDHQSKTGGHEKIHYEDETALGTIVEVKSPASTAISSAPRDTPKGSTPEILRLGGTAASAPSREQEEFSDGGNSDLSSHSSQTGRSDSTRGLGQRGVKPTSPSSEEMELPPLPSDEFARSKPDFDLAAFSSDDTPGGSQMGFEDIMARDQETSERGVPTMKNLNTKANPVTPTKSLSAKRPDPTADSESAIVDDAPTTPTSPTIGSNGLPKRKSFSSAGFLGFRGERLMMDPTGLRRALGAGGSSGGETPSSPSPSPPGETDSVL